jgi:hypothetical protein
MSSPGRAIGPFQPQQRAIDRRLKHDPEKCEAVFPRDKRGTRLRGDHAQTKSQSAMTILPNLIAL